VAPLDEPVPAVPFLLDPAWVVFDPLVLEGAQGGEPVEVGGDSGFPAAADVVDLAQPRGDLTALGGAVVVELFQCLALVVAGEPLAVGKSPGGTALSTWAG
jgi:hypothetical protein